MIEYLIILIKRAFWRHKWDHYAPYRRQCRVCGRHEVSHCQSMKTWNKSWWEAYDDGDSSKHFTEQSK